MIIIWIFSFMTILIIERVCNKNVDKRDFNNGKKDNLHYRLYNIQY